MLLEIVEGQETYISAEKLQDKNYFMYSAYCNALLALINTVKQCQRWKERQDGQDCQKLGDYGVTNIITFAAPRGGGKTSAMRSFTAAMAYPESFLNSDLEGCEILKGTVFLPLPLIIPSVLRPGQGILPVVLSRMYQMAEDLWKEKTKQRRNDAYYQSGPSEAEKSELLCMFQQCLSGINAVKSADGTTMDLSRLHELSDGASLCQSFYELVQRLLRFADCPNGFLVLQLDDADSQVGQGYEILEDIRKYLMIPNLIILMAADFPMLRTVVLKHHCTEFRDALSSDLIDSTEVKSLTGKYLDKLIPPLNLVYLPKLGQYSIQYGNNFRLRYLRNGEVIWESRAGVSFQSEVLAQIYQKTGMAFVSHTSYQNNIIPTTLRGLKQLLEILAHMPEIPEVTAANQRTAVGLARRVKQQAEIAVENLARFSDYFIQDWISVKILNEADQRFLARLFRSPVTDRLQIIRDHLEKRCNEIKFTCPAGDYSHAAIMQCIEEASMKSRRQEDYLFFFAIRTILSLDCHRRIWIQKKRAAEECIEKKYKWLLFALNTETAEIPGTYYISAKNSALKASEIIVTDETVDRIMVDKPVRDIVLTSCILSLRGDKVSLSYMQILNLFLNLGIPVLRKFVFERTDDLSRDGYLNQDRQRILYDAQETALFVAANWEVQRRLLVDWEVAYTRPSNMWRGESAKADNTAGIIREIFAEMDKELEDMNEGTLWSPKPSKSLGDAFRALCVGDIIHKLDFGLFYDDLCEMLRTKE